MQVIPTINVNSFEEIKERAMLVESYSQWIQLDVSDGTFSKNTNWHNSADLLSFETPLNVEIHIMVDRPEERIDEWLIGPVKRIIFHLEASKDPYIVIDKCHKAGKEVGIAIGPGVSWTQLMPFCGKVDLFQILAVEPGPAGQKFQEQCLEKIEYLKKNCPSTIIEVDGGVGKIIAKKVKDAGADIVAVASAVFGSEDIGKAIKELEEI